MMSGSLLAIDAISCALNREQDADAMRAVVRMMALKSLAFIDKFLNGRKRLLTDRMLGGLSVADDYEVKTSLYILLDNLAGYTIATDDVDTAGMAV